MSKNFELLQRAERMDTLMPLSITAAPSKSPGSLTASKPVQRHPDATKTDAMAREEALKLVHRIFYAQGASEVRMVVFAGVGSGDACARVCAATGEVLAAQRTGTVCVVDADLRSPSIHEFFNTDNLSGLSDALLTSESVRSLALQTSQSNLWVVPGGGHLSLPALLNSEQMIRRLADFRREFDYVLVSAPPADLFAEAATLGRVADGAVLVVEADRSLREAARKAKQVLESAEVRLLGAVLNDRTFPIPQALYNRLG